VFFILIAVWVLYFRGLDAVGLLGPDEPRYAWIGRAMQASGDWITPRLWGEPWFEKPALLYWLIGFGHQLGLNEELAARLPIAVVAVLFLAAYYRLLVEHLGQDAALFSTAILGTSAGWIGYSRIAVTDLPMTACLGLSLLLSLEWIEHGDTRRLSRAGIWMGLAVLAKGLVPVVLAAPLFAMQWKRWREWWRLIVPAMAVALPWYLWCTLRNGWAFPEEFFLRHHFGRFASEELQHVQPFWYYVPVLLGGLFPWTPLVALLLRRRPEMKDRVRVFLWAWVLFGFVFLSASTNKLPGYVLPLLPALAALLGAELSWRHQPRWVLALSAGLLGLWLVIGNVLPDALAVGLRRALPGVDWRSQLLQMASFCAVGVLLAWWTRKHLFVAAMVAMVTVTMASLQDSVLPRLEEQVSVRAAWQKMEARREEVCLDHPHRASRYGLNYYARMVLPDCEERPLPLRWSGREE
jgi:4-amino-4-deoxy-L-arabinose transferase-like glycosyltransferase